ncbi:MAG: hypothetical protein AAF990_06625 [Bacteroidota bacterium]
MKPSFPPAASLYLIAGKAGCGKTRLLKRLSAMGAQVIDLEGLAAHKGSAFGNLQKRAQPTRQSFYECLEQQWQKMDLSQPIFLESEGPYLGSLDIPKSLFQQMEAAPVLLLRTDRTIRVANILADYLGAPLSVVEQAIDTLAPKLGLERSKACRYYLRNGDWPAFVDVLLDYYDQSFYYQVAPERVVGSISLQRNDYNKAAQSLLKKVAQLV